MLDFPGLLRHGDGHREGPDPHPSSPSAYGKQEEPNDL